MSNVEIKRREYSRLFEDVSVTHAQLKEYFTVYAKALSLDRSTNEFKDLKMQLKSLDPLKLISCDINRYFRIYTMAETIKREYPQVARPRDYGYFGTPQCLQHSRRFRIPKNKDIYCFRWSILFAIHHKTFMGQCGRVKLFRQFIPNYDFDMFYEYDTPIITLDTLHEFETKNNIAVFIVNLDTHDRDYEYNLEYSPSIPVSSAKHVVYLGILTDTIDNQLKHHYISIVCPSYAFKVEKPERKNKRCLHCEQEFGDDKELYFHHDNECTMKKKWVNIGNNL